VETLGAIYLSD